MTRNAIIIGAGTAGLSIAALLANAGYKTLVLEQQNFVGGRARTWHKDGFIVDYGIHTLRGAYQKVFHPLKMELQKARMPLSKGIIVEDRGVLHKLPKLSSLFRTKMLTLKDLNFVVRHLGALLLGNPQKYFKISIKQWLDSINASPQIENLFKIISMTLMVCPFLERASLGEFILMVKQLNLLGFGHPKGGFQQVHRALIWKIQACGGRIQLGTKVDEIQIKDGTAIGVKTAEQEIPADIVVSAIPVQHLPMIVDETILDKAYLNKIKTLRPTAGISFDYGLSEKMYKEVMFLVPDPAILGSFTSNIDPSTAPKNKQLVTFLNVLNVEDVKHRQRAQEKSRKAEDRIFSMFPEMAKKIEWKRTLIFEMVDGVELNTKQTQDRRPDVQVPNITNLFLASDSTCAEGAGGDIAFSSARLCYDRILQGGNPI